MSKTWVEMEMLRDDTLIKWCGFTATISTLRSAGWKMEMHFNTYAKFYRLTMRHPDNRQMVRTKLWPSDMPFFENPNEVLDLDACEVFQEWNQRITPPKILVERDLTEDDLQALYDCINAIYAAKPKKKKTIKRRDIKASAEIVDIRDFLPTELRKVASK